MGYTASCLVPMHAWCLHPMHAHACPEIEWHNFYDVTTLTVWNLWVDRSPIVVLKLHSQSASDEPVSGIVLVLQTK